MNNYGFLCLILLITVEVNGSNRNSQEERLNGPEDTIDLLAYKAYQRRLRQEQRERQLARQQNDKPYEGQAQNYGNMQDLKRDVLGKDSESEQTTTTTESITADRAAAQNQAAPDAVKPVGSTLSNVLFIAVVAGCSVAGLIGLVVAGVCWYKLQKNVKAASEAEYPAYGITGPTKERVQSPGDRKLAQSAQMYHYQHQKQQMIAMEKANSEMKHDGSDEDSEEENEEGDYTVYECPGLAPTGEMEVKNPLFSEDTPVTPTVPGSDHK